MRKLEANNMLVIRTALGDELADRHFVKWEKNDTSTDHVTGIKVACERRAGGKLNELDF